MTEFLMCLMQYMTHYGAVIEADAFAELYQAYKIQRFVKRIMPKWLNMHHPRISLNILENS